MRRYIARHRSTTTPVLTLALVVLLWEFAARVGHIPQYLLPAPSDVIAYTFGHVDFLAPNTWVTLQNTIYGFALAIVFGVGLSIFIVWWQTFEDAVYPIVITTQVIPKVAIAPLLIVYMGFGQSPKVVLAFIVSFFPMVINATLGMKSVDPELLELLATLKATRWQVMYKVRFMRALPYIIEGAKIAITLAIIGAIVGEFVSGSAGLGYLIVSASASLDTVLCFSVLFVLTSIGLILFSVINVFGKMLTPWASRDAR